MQGGRCCRQKKKKKESISCKRSDEYERVGELQVPQSKINLSTDHMPAKESSEWKEEIEPEAWLKRRQSLLVHSRIFEFYPEEVGKALEDFEENVMIRKRQGGV